MILRRINNSREVKFFFNENKEERLVFFNLQTYYSFPRRELSSTTHWQNIFLAVAMPTKGYVYAFNNVWGDLNVPEIFSDIKEFKYTEVMGEFRCYMRLGELIHNSYDCYIAPPNILNVVNDIISKNKKLLKPITDEIFGSQMEKFYEVSVADASYLFAICLFDDKPNILAWLLRLLKTGMVRERFITNLYNWLEYNSKTVSKLSKGTLTAYKTSMDVALLESEMEVIRVNNLTSSIINEFNTAQRQMLKGSELSYVDMVALRKLSLLSDVKRLNFIRKVSNITDVKEFFTLLKTCVNAAFEWNPKSLKEFIDENELKTNIIYDKDNIVILEVFDYEAVNKIGKNTNWCISKQKQYWNNYVGNYGSKVKQFVMINFNYPDDHDLSIIGITTERNGFITHSHSFVNHDLAEQMSLRKKYYKNIYNIGGYNIISILELFNVPLNVFADNNIYPYYEWNKESVLKYFNDNNLGIYYEEKYSDDNHLIISTNTFNLSALLGDKLSLTLRKINDANSPEYYLIFFDFTKPEKDAESLFIAVINNIETIPYFYNIYNYLCEYNAINVKELCRRFNIEDDALIYRPNRIDLRFRIALIEEDFETVFEMIDKYGATLLTYNKRINEKFWYLLSVSLNDCSDFFLNFIYSKGIKLTEITTFQNVSELLGRLLEDSLIYEEQEKKIKDTGMNFYRTNPNKINNSVTSYMTKQIFMTIVKNENNADLLNYSFENLRENGYKEKFIISIFKEIIDTIPNAIRKSDTFKEKLFMFIFEQDYDELLNYLITKLPDIIDDKIQKSALIALDEDSKFYDLIVANKRNNEFSKPYKN